MPERSRFAPVRAAAKIGGVAAGAIGLVERLAADQHVLRRELAGELGEPAAAAAAALTACLAGAALTAVGAAAGCGLVPASARRGRSLRWCRSLRQHQAGHRGARKNRGQQSGECVQSSGP